MLRGPSFELSGVSEMLDGLSGALKGLSPDASGARLVLRLKPARPGGLRRWGQGDQAAGLGLALPLDLRTLIASRRVSRPSLLPKSFISV